MIPSKTIFISDLHLQETNAESLGHFLDFMTHHAPSCEALYILGDFFEAYIGDDHHNAFITSISQSLKNLHETYHTKIYLMQGNRDFLMGHDFAKRCGATLLPDPTVIDLYGTKTLLTHGDGFCSDDTSYQVYRKIMRSKLIRCILLLSPLSFRQKLAAYLRNKSKQHTQQTPKMILDVSPSAVENAAKTFQVTQLIHGHTHRPQVHHENTFTRYVLPDWHPKGGMLCARVGHTLELIRWE